jgi:hypothetical protein
VQQGGNAVVNREKKGPNNIKWKRGRISDAAMVVKATVVVVVVVAFCGENILLSRPRLSVQSAGPEGVTNHTVSARRDTHTGSDTTTGS